MKKTIILGLLTFLLIYSVSAVAQETNYTLADNSDNSGLSVVQLRYEPYPVNPGDYFDLYIKAEQGSGSAPNAWFELMPTFPFSLDSNEQAIRNYGKIYSDPVVLHYKVRVSEDVVEGTNEISLMYNSGAVSSADVIKKFDIEVADAQTDFDLVLQESTETEVSIAIANTGKNVANSLIVRIPTQEGFRVTGTDGQMVGNLDSGDYSIVGFGLTPNRENTSPLKVQMDYTDTIGKRRTVIKEIRYSATSAASNFTMSDTGFRRTTTQTNPGTKWIWMIILLAVIIAVFILHRKNPEKFRKYFSKDKTQKKKSETPPWVIAERKK
jgi:hypothetical protein